MPDVSKTASELAFLENLSLYLTNTGLFRSFLLICKSLLLLIFKLKIKYFLSSQRIPHITIISECLYLKRKVFVVFLIIRFKTLKSRFLVTFIFLIPHSILHWGFPYSKHLLNQLILLLLLIIIKLFLFSN